MKHIIQKEVAEIDGLVDYFYEMRGDKSFNYLNIEDGEFEQETRRLRGG